MAKQFKSFSNQNILIKADIYKPFRITREKRTLNKEETIESKKVDFLEKNCHFWALKKFARNKFEKNEFCDFFIVFEIFIHKNQPKWLYGVR